MKKLSLKEHASAQCYVCIDEYGAVHFISYTTLVITIDPEGWLTCTGTYSQTTRKQIGWFLKEYAPSLCYHDAKRAHEKDLSINIHTGEVQTIT